MNAYIYIKVYSNAPGRIPIILQINEALYLKNNPITLISEYQVRQYGLVIDSVAIKHRTTDGKFGTQQLYVSPELSILFEDTGALMGFEVLPMEKGDEEKYEIHMITGDKTWKPYKFKDMDDFDESTE